MGKIITVAILSFLTFSLYAVNLSEASLQGSWVIIEFQGEAESEGDKWEFEGSKFYQNMGGRRISPDTFTVSGNIIDLGYGKIKVKRFDGKTMEANMAGFDYKLKKQ